MPQIEEVEKDVVEVGVVDDQTEEDWVQKLWLKSAKNFVIMRRRG